MFIVIFGVLGLVCFAYGFYLITSQRNLATISSSSEMTEAKQINKFLKTRGSLCVWAGVIVVSIASAIYPFYNVWQRGMDGQASMAEAEANRQIKVREAQATRDAAELLAEAEVLRAKGVAQANKIVADGLGGPEGYLRYLYIDGLKEGQAKGTLQVIYVATEAGLPILEANRLKK